MKNKLLLILLAIVSPLMADTTNTATVGQSVTITVTVAPPNVSLPLTYVWRRDANTVPGNNQPTLTIPTLTAGDAGAYTVTVSNAFGSVVSDRYILIVNPPPVPPTAATLSGTIR